MARFMLEREMGSVLTIDTEPSADDRNLVAVQVTFVFQTGDNSRQIAYGLCDAYGNPIPDPVLPRQDADEFIKNYWRLDSRRFPIYYHPDEGPTTARMYFTDGSRQELHFHFGLILLLCPVISLGPALLIARSRQEKVNRKLRSRDNHPATADGSEG